MDYSSTTKTGFLGLPVELRYEVYKELVSLRLNKLDKADPQDGYSHYRLHLNFLRVNRQIHDEGIEALRRENVFIHVDTPWRSAEEHVAVDGRVPLLAIGKKADKFQNVHMVVRIDLPDIENQPSVKFVIALEDLEAFCKVWYYADLSNPGMNSHFGLSITLLKPGLRPWVEESGEIPLGLQKRLLLPFGAIKGLRNTVVKGKHDPTIEQEMRKACAVPYESPESCLERCTQLKDKGNAEYVAKRYREAIDCYEQAFKAMHILISGRRRKIYADPFFEKILDSGPNRGDDGITVRFKLRIILVANIIEVFLKLEEYEEAKFWGQRSINIMRENFGDGADNPHPHFPAAASWGKIFYRTALACKALEDTTAYEEYARIAAAWLPNEPRVQKERTASAPRLL